MEKLGTEVVDLFKKVQEVSNDYADIKDILVDDSSAELLEDSVSVLKLLNCSRKAFLHIKFKAFLRGLNRDNANKESIERLVQYVENQDRAEFITNSFDKVLFANSKLVCCLIGIMINELVVNKRDVSQEELMLLQALSVLNDFDVTHFYYLHKQCCRNKGYNRITESCIAKVCENIHTTPDKIALTIKMLEKANLIEKDAEVRLDMDETEINPYERGRTWSMYS